MGLTNFTRIFRHPRIFCLDLPLHFAVQSSDASGGVVKIKIEFYYLRLMKHPLGPIQYTYCDFDVSGIARAFSCRRHFCNKKVFCDIAEYSCWCKPIAIFLVENLFLRTLQSSSNRTDNSSRDITSSV